MKIYFYIHPETNNIWMNFSHDSNKYNNKAIVTFKTNEIVSSKNLNINKQRIKKIFWK